ncbi:MAG: hypothetical protein MZV70_30265 [Desulfobacterales bacterium]|nr:hypothetical protein [Desulfobacterales bacterium]
MNLNADLRALALSLDADYFGVADLSSAHDVHSGAGRGTGRPVHSRAVTIGMSFAGQPGRPPAGRRHSGSNPLQVTTVMM